MRNLTFLILPMLLFCTDPGKGSGQQAEVLNGTEIGIESIKDNGDGTLDVAIYMYTTVPVAGFQANLLPKENFTIESVYGGIGEEKGFMMKGGKSTFLGFSIKGDVVSESNSRFLNDNILCILKVAKNEDFKLPIEVSLDPIIAGKKGVKLKAVTKSFLFNK